MNTTPKDPSTSRAELLRRMNARIAEGRRLGRSRESADWFSPAEHAVLAAAMNVKPPRSARGVSAWDHPVLAEYLDDAEDEDHDEDEAPREVDASARRARLVTRLEADANLHHTRLSCAVGKIAMRDVDDEAEGEARRPKLEASPLLGINWASSGPGFDCPES
jgi:hypothetical protein